MSDEQEEEKPKKYRKVNEDPEEQMGLVPRNDQDTKRV